MSAASSGTIWNRFPVYCSFALGNGSGCSWREIGSGVFVFSLKDEILFVLVSGGSGSMSVKF